MALDKNNPDHVLTLLFLLFIRQMSGLADCFRHILKEGALHSGDTLGWKAYIQTELADTIELVKKVCDLFKISFEGTIELGRIRDSEKKREYLRRHPEEFWV